MSDAEAAEGQKGCGEPQRVDAEGPGVDAGSQEADTKAKTASAELHSRQRGFCWTGFLNTCFWI